MPFIGGDRVNRLAVCAEMVFTDLPFVERVKTLHDLGFAVEIWHWWTKDLDDLAATGATFTSMSGYVDGELVTGEMWLAAHRTLAWIAELGKKHDVVFVPENLNLAVDHPGTPFAKAADTRALVAAVDSPHLRMNLDLYHAQIGEGNLIQLIRDSAPWLGEVQVADVPGRCEPGTGEINHSALARALREVGYTGTIAMEAHAAGDSLHAVKEFRRAYS